MPLPPYVQGQGMGLADAVEASLEGLADDLLPADMALVTTIRMAAELIDDLAAEGEAAKAMAYMYLVRDGMEKLGGSVKARKDLGKKPPEQQRTGLAAVRSLRSGGADSAQNAPKRRRKASGE